VIGYTERGFTVYDEFTDRYGGSVTVQESSLATEPACWIFHHGGGGAIHLTVDQASRVCEALQAFIEENT
jgi:hypothetical protein